MLVRIANKVDPDQTASVVSLLCRQLELEILEHSLYIREPLFKK